MLEDHAQRRQPIDQRLQHAVDEHRLAVEDVDIGRGHFAVDAQRHADIGHAFEHAHDVGDVGNAMRGIGGGAGGIELGRGQHAVGMACGEIVRVALVGKVSGHQRSEIQARGHCG